MAMTCLYRLEIISTCAETVQQRETKAIPGTHCHQSICMDRDCTRLNSLFFLYNIIALCKKKNLFNKLIHAIQIFLRKYFVVQHYPRNIFNIELFPNYGIAICLRTCVHTYINVCKYIATHSRDKQYTYYANDNCTEMLLFL